MLTAAGYRFRLDDTLNRFYVAEERPDVFERLPATRGDWGAVVHMYEIGKAPENPIHPDHGLAKALTRAFWASLPAQEPRALATLLAEARGLQADAAGVEGLLAEVQSDDFRVALARIACGYDGGQLG
jgi:hypothetical protein